jgi:hypothetical protein
VVAEEEQVHRDDDGHHDRDVEDVHHRPCHESFLLRNGFGSQPSRVTS